MLETMTKYLEGLKEVRWRRAVREVALPALDRLSTQPMTTAGLGITAGGATTVKTGAAIFYASVQGKIVSIAANTTLPALTGVNASANNYQIAAFFVDTAGTVTVAGGQQGPTAGTATFPNFPQGRALVGYILTTNGASAFTGGTTPLDTATTLYFSPVGPFDPSALI